MRPRTHESVPATDRTADPASHAVRDRSRFRTPGFDRRRAGQGSVALAPFGDPRLAADGVDGDLDRPGRGLEVDDPRPAGSVWLPDDRDVRVTGRFGPFASEADRLVHVLDADFVGQSDGDDRHVGHPDEPFGDAADEDSIEAGPSLRPHDDQVDALLVRVVENLLVWHPPADRRRHGKSAVPGVGLDASDGSLCRSPRPVALEGPEWPLRYDRQRVHRRVEPIGDRQPVGDRPACPVAAIRWDEHVGIHRVQDG